MDELEVRSYRAVFELERRVYRVDTVRLNPGGVPVRGLLYGAVLVASIALLARVPVIGVALAALPWYVLYVGVPGLLAAALTLVQIEGRSFHLAVRALLAQRLGARYVSGWTRARKPGSRWSAPPIVLVPDGSDGKLARLRFSGPGAILVAVTHDRIERGYGPFARGAHVTLRARPDQRPLRRAVVVDLQAGAVLRCMPDR